MSRNVTGVVRARSSDSVQLDLPITALQPCYLRSLVQLLDEDLKPIFDLRDDYAKGIFERVAFANL